MTTKIEAIASLRPGAVCRVVGDVVEWLDEIPTEPNAAEIQAGIARLEAEQPWKTLRAERDWRLAETDWWVLPDRTATTEQLAYRQALRDLPANTTDPANPVWPTKP